MAADRKRSAFNERVMVAGERKQLKDEQKRLEKMQRGMASVGGKRKRVVDMSEVDGWTY